MRVLWLAAGRSELVAIGEPGRPHDVRRHLIELYHAGEDRRALDLVGAALWNPAGLLKANF